MNTGFPDVCTTPAAPSPIPVPYPNIGMNAMAMPFVPNVLVSMAPAQNMGAKPTLTNGDNAGVAHPMFMQPGGTTMGKPNLLIGGMPAAHLLNPTYGNNYNNPVGAKTVPSVTNVLLGFRSRTARSRLSTTRSLFSEQPRMQIERGVLQIHIPVIGLDTGRRIRAGLAAASRASLQGIALDLRSNPGGVVGVAAEIARALQATGLPIAVATDRKTASAAELLAAALDAKTFGTRTFGKGHATTFDLLGDRMLARPDSATLRFSLQDGTPIDGNGLAPDRPCAATAAHAEATAWIQRG